jgi:hypothetical protein
MSLIYFAELKIDFEPTKKFELSQCEPHFDYLYAQYGKNKFFNKKFELPALVALSFYPALKNIEIEFVNANIKTTLETRPTTSTILKKQNRSYTIYIDNDTEGNGILLENVPFNAQIGILGHEFAHILDYEQRSSSNLIGLGISYLNEVGKEKLEKKIDKLTIDNGLGWQLYDWSDFVLNKSKASQKYKDFKRRIYMQPEEIERTINANPIYNKIKK